MKLNQQFQSKLDEWTIITKEIHEQLQDDNIEDGSKINLTYAFSNPDEKLSNDFSRIFEKELGYKSEVDFLPEDGEEPAIYVIFGQMDGIKSYLNNLKDLLTRIISLGAKYNCTFEYWEASLPSNENRFNLSIGSFDDSDELKENFPILLHLKVYENIGPIDRGEKYREPLEELLDTYNLGTMIRSGSICSSDNGSLEIDGFEMIFRIADQKKSITHIKEFLNHITTQDKFELKIIDEDIL